jgi:PAS domain S-box-containing protein/diguanylate cyclase (GGDEF)-like protein
MTVKDESILPEELLRQAVAAMDEGIAVLDGEVGDGPVLWVNPAFEHMSGFERSALLGSTLRVLQGSDREQAGLAELEASMAGERGCRVLLRNYRPDGAMYWNELRLEPVRDAAGQRRWLVFSRDVSQLREMELMLGRGSEELDRAQQRLQEIDPNDRLTGLQSAAGFELSLELAWFSCARDRRSLTLFVFAPDYFDVYLETFGRVAGDSCLRMLARAVSSAFRRASDITARLDEAEFAAIGFDLPPDSVEPHAQRVCERVRALAIRNPHAPLVRDLTLSAAVLRASPGRDPHWRKLLEEARSTLAASQGGRIEQIVVRDYGSATD